LNLAAKAKLNANAKEFSKRGKCRTSERMYLRDRGAMLTEIYVGVGVGVAGGWRPSAE
jgi:hypothetical protein